MSDSITRPRLILFILWLLLLGTMDQIEAVGPAAAEATRLSDLSLPLQYTVSEAIGRDQSAYHPERQANGFRVATPAQGYTTHFGAEGMTLTAGQSRLQMQLTGVGYGEPLTPVAAALPTSGNNRIEYGRGNVTEWYVNGPLGLQQGFTLEQRPERTGSGNRSVLAEQPLTLALAVSGGWHTEVSADGRDLSLTAADASLRYGGLIVVDASGQNLPAGFRLDPKSGIVNILIDDHAAIYPLTIDPFIQQAYLKASNAEANDNFGWSVAISGDTVVIGARYEDSNGTGEGDNSASDAGAAYVFVRSGVTWNQQAYLKASNAEAVDYFGHSVAISGDTVVIGAMGEDSNGTGEGDNSASNAGAAYVFVRSGVTWSQQAYLKASNAEADDEFGRSVTISGDTVVITATGEDSNGTGEGDNSASKAGAAYVFVRSGVTWGQQAYLKASNAEAVDYFGRSVAISGDTVVIGAYREDSNGTGDGDNSASNAGAAYVFVRSGVTWSQQAYLKASNAEVDDEFGRSVAISGDTVVIGAYTEDSNGTGEGDNSATYAGAAYVFVRSGVTWSQQAYLKASNAETGDWFGQSVAISGDTVVIGASREDSNGTGVSDNSASMAGAAYVFVRSGVTWGQQAYLKASNAEAGDWFGESVAISGGTVVIGAITEDSNGTGEGDDSATDAGAAYVYIVQSQEDLGDAPDPGYPTLPASTGASHVLGNGVYLGACVDAEADGQPSVDANGDDVAVGSPVFGSCVGNDDEDGVSFTSALIAGTSASVDVTANAACTLSAWIDFNGAGEWADAGEDLFPGGQTLAAGVNNLSFAVPAGAVPGTSYARFRCTTDGAVTYTGQASDGEVEDYTVTISQVVDLAVTKDDGVTSAVPGESVTYTITASNAGPSDEPAATLTDTFPADLTCTFTSVEAGGATGNTASGAGDLSETLALPVGSSVTYTVSCTIDPAATGTLTNTATISGAVTDPTPGNNSATDGDTVLAPETDLGITKDDGVTSAVPGESVTYTILASNAGPSNAVAATVADTFPAGLSGCAWTCIATGTGVCNADGSGDVNESVDLAVGDTVTFTATCTIDVTAGGTLSNTATIAAGAGATDPETGDNSATDDDTALLTAVFFDPVTHAAEDETVDVPVHLATAGQALGSVAFSIDYDDSCLDFDPTDDNLDDIPDSITVNATNVPADFTVTVIYDALDTDGEIDISIADIDPSVATLVNGELLTVHYAVTCPVIPVTPVDSAMAFSLDPSATFGDTASGDVTGAQVDGVVRVWPGPRGDCNGGDSLGSADLTAIGEEMFDADTDDWFEAPNFYPGSPVGCDANASTKIRVADVTCANELYFGGDCGAIVEALTSPSGLPELRVGLAADEGVVWIRAGLTSNGHAVGGLAFSLDLDPALFPLAAVDADGDGRPDHLRFPNGKPGLARVAFDAGDEDGELDVLLAALRRSPLAEGLLVEVGVPVAAVPAGGLRFSATPSPSFGTVTGADIDGRASVEGTVLFVDGFESGSTDQWSQTVW